MQGMWRVVAGGVPAADAVLCGVGAEYRVALPGWLKQGGYMRAGLGSRG